MGETPVTPAKAAVETNKPILPLSSEDFKRELEACMPRTSSYRWMIRLLKSRSRAIGGWFPHKIHALLRRFGNPQKPFFVCEYRNGFRYMGDYRDVNSMSYALYADETDDPLGELRPLVQGRRGAFLDIGANFGLYSAAMAKEFPDREVFAFEPVPATVRRAAATFALNSLSNIHLYAAAAGDTDSEIVFYDAPGCSEYASAVPTEQAIGVQWKEIRVPCVRLDSLASQIGITEVSLLKIDAEGFEPKVIAGAEALIGRTRPNIVYEYNYSIAPKAGWTASDVAMQIQRMGAYDFFLLRDKGVQEKFIPPQEVDGVLNIFCQSVAR